MGLTLPPIVAMIENAERHDDHSISVRLGLPVLDRLIHQVLRLTGVDVRRPPDLRHGARPVSLPAACLSSTTVLVDREALIRLVPEGGQVAELGVGFGAFSRRILDIAHPSLLVAADLFTLHEKAKLRTAAGRHIFGTASHEEFYREKFRAEIDAGVLHVRTGPSHTALTDFDDATFDLIYVDANHSYEAVKQDLEASYLKVRPGGLLVLDDYERGDPFGRMLYGVKHAAHEFCLEQGWPVKYLSLENAASASNVVFQRPLG